MFDDTIATWWYEEGGQQAGPVTAATLHRLIAGGRISRAHRVWKNGMAGWEPIGLVAELAPMLGDAGAPMLGDAGAPMLGDAGAPTPPAPQPPPPVLPPPPIAGFPRPEPASPRAAPTHAGGAFEPIPVGVTILLAIVTFGIYGLVKFYQTARSYEQLAGRESKFALYFWLFIGLGLGGIFVNAAAGPLGVPLGIASVVFQFLSLVEALQVRDEGVRRNGIAAPVTSATAHKTLLILAIALSFILVGLVFTIILAVKWFSDWNEIVAAMQGRGRAAP